MTQIDLGGFLLTPIQRICRYPLQLKELKKTYDESDDLFEFISQTMELMVIIANDINEKKRKFEDQKKIQSFQSNCLHFRGSDILQNK